MRFEGRIFKDGKYWLAEVPALYAVTQGRSKKETIAMVCDLVETMIDRNGFKATICAHGRSEFELCSNDSRALLALMLRRQRERSGLSLADVAKRLGQRSRNAYARYEQGKVAPTVDQLEELLGAVSPKNELVWRLAA